ncbi:ATP-grasp domain-containing protein [Ideonella sp. YS5]|uniref:ATP-grasp domain-containing protein n=1 Tax=Ideonella sp. YS5 TaxID=3453714 RepID=UPI003EEEA682
MAVLAVAGLSARAPAEAARCSGYEVIALDLFGDQDTREASLQWMPIGDPARMRIEPARVLSALASLAERGDVAGWVVGGGFDGHAALLEEGAALLPLVGNAARTVERIRDPAGFFAALDRHGIAHPEVQVAQPADPAGWLLKDAHGSGGWHIQRAQGRAPLHHYFEREVPGAPMSATFIAAGCHATVLGFNELIVQPLGSRPFVYRGVVGPVSLPDAGAATLRAALDRLVGEFSLRGLGSLDFIWDGRQACVLEINPRLPASLSLYDWRVVHGVMRAHVQACLEGESPRLMEPPSPPAVSGQEIVFARRPLQIGDRAIRHLASRPDVHDRPWGQMMVAEGDPVCSLSARGSDAQQVRALLRVARDQLLDELETMT